MTSTKSAKASESRSAGRKAQVFETPASEIEARTGDLNFMTSFARGLAVISAFREQGASLTIADLSRAVGIPRAAVRRCLYTLEQLGYVTSDDQGFSLKPKILTLGYAYLSSNKLTKAAQPLLDRVSAEVQESCSLATLSDDHIVYVARAMTSKRIMSIDIAVGTRLPAYCTSMGRVLLADLEPEDVDAALSRVKLRAYTERTVTSREKLRQILLNVRRAGHAVVDQELELGLRSIAVPVYDASSRVIAAMNVGTQAARFGIREMEAKILPPLRDAAMALGSVLR